MLGILLIGGLVGVMAFLRYKPAEAPTSDGRLIDQNGRAIYLHRDFIIGRNAACDYVIPDPAVSRQHARLRWSRGQWFIQDLGSSGGILVNGSPVRASRLNSGDRIQIGQNTFFFQD